MIDLNLLTAEHVYDLVTTAATDANVATLHCHVVPAKGFHPLAVLTIKNFDGSCYLQHIFEVDYYSHLYDVLAEYDLYNRKSIAAFVLKLGTFRDVPFPAKTYPLPQAA